MSGLDAHVHLWNRTTDPQPWIDPDEMAVIDRDFGLSELDEMLDSSEVDSAVVVQAANSSGETERLLDMAASSGPSRIAGVVGWLDLTSDIDSQLDRLGSTRRGRLVGVRHLVHLDQDPRWLARPDVGRALDRLAAHDLGFDLVLRPTQLELAAEIVSAHPATRFALDHLGGIVESDDDVEWDRGLRMLAQRDNVVVKLSGLARLADEAERQGRALDAGLSAFGPSRCLYGSDWPLAELGSGGTAAWRSTFLAAIGHLSPAEKYQVSGGAGVEFYRLAVP